MSDNLPSTAPSLARAFADERDRLRDDLRGDAQVTDMVVLDARRALDRTGARFAKSTDDPLLQKAGLWLIEMVKSGAGVLDNGTEARVSWSEVAGPKRSIWAGRGLFYGAAGVFAVAGFVQGSGLVMLSAAVLAGLRAFDPSRWKDMLGRLPFAKKQVPLLEDARGRSLKVDAQVAVNVDGFVDALTEALNTADHILLRFAEPTHESHWRDNARLMGVVQNLLEASAARDGDFALKLVEQELASVLQSENVSIVHYTKKTAHLFDALPALGETQTREAAPALISGETVLRRGTIWVPA